MKPKTLKILEQAIEEGLSRGYHRAYKHNDKPTTEEILDEIETAVMGSIYEYFTFDEDDQ